MSFTWSALGASEPPRRIRGNIDENRTFQLDGNTRGTLIAQAQDQGEVDGSLPLTRVTMHFAMTAVQRTDLDQLLKQQVDRKTAQYHKWLTPEEFGGRFGLNSSDTEKISQWLEVQGFSNVEVARSRTAISFSGNAAQVKGAFRTSIHHYAMNGQTHFANASDPVLPQALQGMVEGIRGLNDVHPRPQARVRPHFTSSLSGNHFLTPADFATIYDLGPLYANGMDGTGQKIVVPGQSDIALTDIQAFRAAAGLPPNDPQIVLTGTDPGLISDDESESDLDIEWAGAIAKNATIIFVTSTDVFTSMTYAINNNLAPIISVTYGECEARLGSAEANTLNSLFQQASAQGITVVAASGDTGAADCDNSSGTPVATRGPAVDMPASSPYVTGLGGTEFNEGTAAYWTAASGGDALSSAISYIPEIAWNDTAADNAFSASGGGASLMFAKPSWQSGTGVPNDGARDIPDLALASSADHDGYLICSLGSCVNGFRKVDTTLNVIGGTSAAAPTFAGIVALLNQYQNSTQGHINPGLYSLASISTDVFHDITTGNNIVSCRQGSTGCPTSLQFGFSAGSGYDQVTGLGSLDAYNFVREWGSDFLVTISAPTLSVARGASGSATVTVTKQGNFAGAVSFTCAVPSALTNTTCSIPGTVTGSGTVTLTITAGATAATPFRRRIGWHGDGPILPLAFAGLGVLALIFWKGNRRPAPLSSVVFGVLLMVASSSCGSGSASTTNTVTTTSSLATPVETANVTVTALSGTLSSSTSISVSVP